MDAEFLIPAMATENKSISKGVFSLPNFSSPLTEAHFIDVLPITISYQHLLQHIFSLFCQQKTSTEAPLQKPVSHTLLLKALNTLQSSKNKLHKEGCPVSVSQQKTTKPL